MKAKPQHIRLWCGFALLLPPIVFLFRWVGVSQIWLLRVCTVVHSGLDLNVPNTQCVPSVRQLLGHSYWVTLGTHWVWSEDVRGDRMHGVIRLSNMIELLPPPLAEGALGDTIGGVACSREGGQLNSPPPYRGRSALGGCCLLKRWRASECNLTPLKGILIISPLAGSELGDTIFPTCISKI